MRPVERSRPRNGATAPWMRIRRALERHAHRTHEPCILGCQFRCGEALQPGVDREPLTLAHAMPRVAIAAVDFAHEPGVDRLAGAVRVEKLGEVALDGRDGHGLR